MKLLIVITIIHHQFLLITTLLQSPIIVSSHEVKLSWSNIKSTAKLSSTSSHEQTDIHRKNHQSQINEKEKYSSLPHTIFSPHGRLYNVEMAALSSSDDSDVSSSLVVAFKFGPNDSIIILSTGPKSPYLFSVQSSSGAKGEEKDGNSNSNDDSSSLEPLWKHNLCINEVETSTSILNNSKIVPSYPLSILSSNLLVGTGGKSIDSITLRDKILEIFLSLSKSMDGMRSTHRIQGMVLSSLLARKVADVLQVSTQDVSAGYGRILSVS